MLSAMGKDDDAGKIMQTALHLPSTTPLEIHQYGRQLLTMKKNTEAMEVFKYNAQRNGDAWPVHVGLARGYAAIGDKQSSARPCEKSTAASAPDDFEPEESRSNLVKALSEGQSIN